MNLQKFGLSNRTALITGGAGGIGRATAGAFLDAGARVIITDVREAPLEAARAAFSGAGHEIDTLCFDVANPDAVADAARALNSNGKTVDILVANAGITRPDTPGESIPNEDWRAIMAVDLDGVYWCCREFGRYMVARQSGTIVTVGSISGLISNKPQRQAHYNSAKAAVHHLSKSLAAEWAELGVRVNSVAPTYVDTPMSSGSFDDPERMPIWMDFTPMRRVAQPEEVAAAIQFLASDAASAITGAVLPVDCGYTVW